MYDEEHRELFAAIKEGRTINNGKYMSYSTLMAIMGREACYSGERIEWDKLMNSPMDLTPPSYAMGAAQKLKSRCLELTRRFDAPNGWCISSLRSIKAALKAAVLALCATGQARV